MVRIKQRYLLVNILYPDPSSWPAPPPSTTAATSKPDQSQAHLRIHAPTADTLSPGLLSKLIREKVADLFGDWGIGKLGGVVSVKYLSPATSTAIIRCPRPSFRLVWTALTHLTHVPEYTPPGTSTATGTGTESGPKRAGALTRPCVFRVVKVSGTMQKVEEEAIRRGRREIARVRGVQEGVVLGALGGLFDDGPADGGGGAAAGNPGGEDSEDVDMSDDED